MTPEQIAASVAVSLLEEFGDCFDRYAQMFFVKQATQQITEVITNAMAAERERCAQVADRHAGPFGGVGLIMTAVEIAAEIRKG